jgi:succinylglutamate desuccinylase
MDTSERIIGIFEGSSPGPLLIAVGAVHGNEPAGVLAIEVFLEMVKVQAVSPELCFKGNFIGVVGNLAAYRANRRFFNHDLNRKWSVPLIEEMVSYSNGEENALQGEEKEMYVLIRLMLEAVALYKPSEVIILDLHTTSASGGVFSIPIESDQGSVVLASLLPAPVVLGLTSRFTGTLLQGISEVLSRYSLHPCPVRGLAFESGQHLEEAAVQRSIIALSVVARAVGCMNLVEVVELQEANFSAVLPRLVRIFYKHSIDPGTNFSMFPGYVNFQYIEKGEQLALGSHGVVCAPSSGYLLMPLYQTQGSDGFFLAEEVDRFD